jgi:glutamate N-acetyltransferase/amino-acid N-acetyltransferase
MADSTDRGIPSPASVTPQSSGDVVYPVAGLRIGTALAGFRRRATGPDLMVVELPEGASCAAVFTRNAFAAAPVIVAREHLRVCEPRYLIVNAGNANAGTGARGVEDARSSCALLAAAVGCAPQAVLPFSTGVIGEPLPVACFETAIPRALENLSPDGWRAGAAAIMTTDSGPKLASRRIPVEGGPVILTGMAKGAGMIRPDMATMLAFIATDVGIDRRVLQEVLSAVVESSFNRITVDGDTSTNDACVLVATARNQTAVAQGPGDSAWKRWHVALEEVAVTLARAIVRDGEGATRLITIDVSGGRNESECRAVAYTVAHSPLVKTAMFAGDPNWGRILAAVGRAGLEELDISGVSIALGDVVVAEGGQGAPDYRDGDAAAVLAGDDVTVRIGLGRGQSSYRIWTCDLSYDYVRINAEYRT